MPAEEFFENLKKFQIATYVGLDDFADKFNFLYSMSVLMLATLAVGAKQYFMSAIVCMQAAAPHAGGVGLEPYVENYCWMNGTLNLPLFSGRLSDATRNKDDQILYYQWVPFVLALQCVLFYVPRVIWLLITHSSAGTNMVQFVELADKAVHAIGGDRAHLVTQIAANIENLTMEHQSVVSTRWTRLRQIWFERLSFFFFSKRLGTYLTCTYIIVKVLYLGNAIFQLWLMHYFLDMRENMRMFGIGIFNDIRYGRTWHETRVFPRVTFCAITFRGLGGLHRTYAQCVLPINMLNEKIYIFLWFWILAAAVLMGFSVILWIIRTVSSTYKCEFIKKYLRLTQNEERIQKDTVERFVSIFLKHDGFFLLKMISLNAGDLVSCQVIRHLYSTYKSKYLKLELSKH